MFGHRLRLARKKAGLTMQELAAQIHPKVSVQAISKYETGKMLPSMDVLIGLSDCLDVSLDYLMRENVDALKKIEFRKHSRTLAQDRAKVEVLVTEKLENYFAIEGILDLPRQQPSFGNLVTQRIDSVEEIDDIASQLRALWSIGIDPIPSMSNLLEEKGVIIIEADLPKQVDGFTCDVKLSGNHPDTEIIVVSRHTSVERKRFNFAHELAHRVIRDTGNSNISLEKAADRFAGAFLVPTEHLSNVAGHRRRINFPELVELKKRYGVSAAAMLVRLGQVGVLSNYFVEHAFRSFARKWRTEEPEPIQPNEFIDSYERPRRFEKLVWQALSAQLIAPIRAAHLLKLPLTEIENGIKRLQD